jgi:hypothetical protein
MVHGQFGNLNKGMNNKFNIGVVVTIVLHISAFVWWNAQQTQTISQLNTQIEELSSKLNEMDDWFAHNYSDISDLVDMHETQFGIKESLQ